MGTWRLGFWWGRGKTLILHPVFGLLTLFGNGLILVSALALYWVEGGNNPQINSYLDALWWGVTSVTTVGYGDIVPITHLGRAIGVFAMICGTAFFWAFTALFATILLESDLSEGESVVVRKAIQTLRDKTVAISVQTAIDTLERELRHLKRMQAEEQEEQKERRS